MIQLRKSVFPKGRSLLTVKLDDQTVMTLPSQDENELLFWVRFFELGCKAMNMPCEMETKHYFTAPPALPRELNDANRD